MVGKYFQDKRFLIKTLISVGALFVLLFSFSVFGLLFNPFLCAVLIGEMFRRKDETKINLKSADSLIGLVLCVLLAYCFFQKWYHSPAIESIALMFHISRAIIVVFFALLFSACAFFALQFAVKCGRKKLSMDWPEPANDSAGSALFPILVCLISAFGVIAVCSKSSFIYPFNDWDDPNCFFTVGKSMMNGVIPYRDLFEQKGPLLYLMHGLAWLISNDTFFGVYILESVCVFAFLYGSYKVLRLYCDRRIIYVIPILAAICYTSLPFKDGDSAEELSLPFLVFSLLIFIRSMKNGTILNKKDSILIGILSSCVFWIKFSLVGMYIGWYLVFAISCVMNKQVRKLFIVTVYIALGIGISTLPFLIYFGVNHALFDWYEVYIYDNLFLYSEESTGTITNVLTGFGHFVEKNKTVYNLCLAGILLAFFERKKTNMWYYPMMMLCTLSLVYMGGRRYRYYSFVMDVFSVCGIICMYKLFLKDVFDRNGFLLKKKVTMAIMLTVVILVSFYLTPNRYLFGVKREEVPQYHFASIIKQEEEQTLLNYGFLDGGFYTTTNIIPNCKAFCKLNIELEEMHDMQNYYVENGLCKFVVSKGELETDNYSLIEKMTFPYNDTEQTFYLYKRIDSK